jgi:hypothetical protein
VWKAHQPAVVFEFDSVGRVSFCAQDMENSILDYLLFRKLRNTWKRRHVLLSDIYRIDNEIFHTGSQKSVKYFSINISGKFGSQKIVFSNKQKRDECRALFLPAIPHCACPNRASLVLTPYNRRSERWISREQRNDDPLPIQPVLLQPAAVQRVGLGQPGGTLPCRRER